MRGKRDLCQPGEKYGMLTVLETWTQKPSPNKSKEKYCRCKCDCGNEIETRARYIRKGHKKSCGCLKERSGNDHYLWQGHGEIGQTTWASIIKGCKRKGRLIPFDLTIEQGWNLFEQQNRKCALSGVEIKFPTRYRRKGVQEDH